MMRQGWAAKVFQAKQQWSTMSRDEVKTRSDSQFSRRNCQTFSWTFNSVDLAGKGKRVMLSGTTSFFVVC